MEWARILVFMTGTVDQELLLRNEYLAAENRILRGPVKGRLKLLDAERAKLGEIGHRLGRKALGEVATAALPETILGWYRRLVARKFDASRARRTPGRPRIDGEVEELNGGSIFWPYGSRMARLQATALAARSVLDGREHGGTLDRVGSRSTPARPSKSTHAPPSKTEITLTRRAADDGRSIPNALHSEWPHTDPDGRVARARQPQGCAKTRNVVHDPG